MAERRTSNIPSLLEQGVSIISADYVVECQNQALIERFGDLTGRKCYEGFFGRKEPCEVCALRRAIKCGASETHEVTSGDGRIYEFGFIPFRDTSGVMKVTEVTTDITERKQAEEALRFSDAAFRSIQESVVATDTEYTITHWNEVSERIYGIKASEAIGKKLFDVIEVVETLPGETAERLKKLETQGYYQDELLHRTKCAEVWVNVSVQAIKDNGRRCGWVALATDITKRKRMEAELKSSQERLRILFEFAPDGYYLNDLKGNFIDGNKVAEEITGYKREELIGKSFLKLKLLPLGEMPKAAALLAKNALGQPTGPDEFTLTRKDGTRVTVEIRTFPVKMEGKTLVLGIARDITERKRAEDEIKRAAEEWRATFNSITDLVFITDKDYKLVRENRAFADVVKMKPEELIGKPCYEIVHGTNEPVPNCPHAKTLETKKPAAGELFEPHLGIHLEVATSPIFNENGEVIASIHIVRDITERKQAEEALRKTQEQLVRSEKLAAIGQLAGGVGHELRNPLAAIKNAVYYIKAKVAESELSRKEPKVLEFLDTMDDEVNSSNKIISDLLGFSRVGKPSVSPARIEKVIEDALSRMAIPENIKLTKRLDADLPEVEIDADQVQQVLVNIILNAVEAMPDGGKLTIDAREKEKFLEVEIADTGCGIPQEAMDKTFDPLFTTKAKGIGLGLAVCKAIIDRHQGNIEVKSQVGKGTTFNIRLPLRAE